MKSGTDFYAKALEAVRAETEMIRNHLVDEYELTDPIISAFSRTLEATILTALEKYHLLRSRIEYDAVTHDDQRNLCRFCHNKDECQGHGDDEDDGQAPGRPHSCGH